MYYIFFAVDAGKKHCAYVYALGVCDVSRKTYMQCPGSIIFEQGLHELSLSPWWCTAVSDQSQERMFSRWPHKPEILNYKKIHDYTEEKPWCTYVLQHKISISASSLSCEDIQRFKYKTVTTVELFSGCKPDESDLKNMKEMEQKLQDRINFYSGGVVPYALLQSKCEELEKGLLVAAGKLYKKFDDGASVPKDKVAQCMMEQNLHILSWIQDLRKVDKFEVRRELQINDWVIDVLGNELKKLNFITNKEFSYNEFSIFGRSRPDFAFFKQTGHVIKAGVVIEQSTQEFQGIKLYGTAVEFKIDTSQDCTRFLPQAFADMVRISHNMLIEALKAGKVVDTIIIYGILVSHTKETCTPLRYIAKFHSSSYKLAVGGETEFFRKFFPFMVFVGLK